MRRAITNAGDQIQSGLKNGFRHKPAMVTLTYRPGEVYQGQHIKEFLRHCRAWLGRRGQDFRYLWVAELQLRGAVHYHVVVWLPQGLTMPKPDKQGWWPHGSTRIEWARRPVGYLTKYCSKGDAVTQFPRGLRLHGRGGLELQQRRIVSWWLLPRYVRDHFTEVGARVLRAIGGGWLEPETGEWFPPWVAPA